MANKREILVNSINQLINNKDLDPQQYYEAIYSNVMSHQASFPTFSLNIKMLKRVEKESCDGYCYETNSMKYDRRYLYKVSNNDHHHFCANCISTWIQVKLTENPLIPIECQACVRIKCQPRTVITDDSICYLMNISYAYLQEIRNNFVDPNLMVECYGCNQSLLKSMCEEFICQHSLCEDCIKKLLMRTLDTYSNYILNDQGSLDKVFFEVRCFCGLEESRKNKFTIDISKSISKYTDLPNIQEYLKLIQIFEPFFMKKGTLIRCKNCFHPMLKVSSVMVCQECKICLGCGKEKHVGMDCNQSSSLLNRYSVDMSRFMTPPPPNGDPNILKVYATANEILNLILPNKSRKITKIYQVSNPYLDHIFGLGKKKWALISDFLTQVDMNYILTNNFSPQATGLYHFPATLNDKPEKNYLLYCEAMYDYFLKDQAPKVSAMQEGKSYIIQHNNIYYLNSLESIRIIYLLEL